MSMSAIKKFEIHLEHDIDEQYQYEPGELIRGQVLLMTSEDIRICSLQIQIRGEATVAWDDETSDAKKQFSATETYMDSTVDLPLTEDAGGPATGRHKGGSTSTSGKPEAVVFGRGEHSFPLEIALPTTIPSSFIGKFGSITYVMKATVREDKLMGLGTTITSEPFLVLRRLDIRDNEELQKPSTVTLSRRVAGKCIFLCLGLVTAEFTVNKTGLLPGDEILIDGQITNDSQRTIKAIQVSLVLKSTFHARNKVREHVQVVNKKEDTCEVEHGDRRTWSSVRLPVPPYIPESRLEGCDMIDITYELQFRVELEKGMGELTDIMPITIGTIQDERRNAGRRKTWNPDNYMIFKGGALADSHYETIPNDVDMDDVDLHEEMMDQFRHPIAPGEVRNNILFEDFGE